MGTVETLAPAGTVAAVLVAVVGYLLNANRVDRQDYRAAVDAIRADLAEEQGRRENVELLLDAARRARRDAEDDAARAARAAERAADQVHRLEADVARLTARDISP